MLTFSQTVKPLSNRFTTKTLNPTFTYPPTFSFPITITIIPKLLCLSETSFPTIATSSTSPSHSNTGTNPNSIPLKSNSNGKKQTKSVRSGKGKVRDLSEVNSRNAKILENDNDLNKKTPNPSGSIPDIKPRKSRRGRRSEAHATEDFIRNHLEQTFTSIRAKNPDLDEKIGKISKEKPNDPETSFPTIATSSTLPSHSNTGTNPNSIPLKSNSNGKKQTKSVRSGKGKVTDLSEVNSRNAKILENHNDLNKKAPNPSGSIPDIKPRKPRRGRRSEAHATEDFICNHLEQTFTSICAKNPDFDEKIGKISKEKPNDPESDSDGDKDSDEDREIDEGAKKGYVEEEDPEWPLDAEVGWSIRASDYFEKHPIKNVVENGVEIDWEGELDNGWIQEINCLEWESFAFHPSPLVVLVFERYKRAADNWKFLMEFEKAAKIYWSCKDRLPPRTVKIDVNIETDLAYALKVTESDCPQLLFLKGNRILYRQKEIRCADDLVRMIAHFYYNAKRPEWMDPAAVASP